MSSITKQLIINRLPVPDVIADIIKEYSFQTIKVMIKRQEKKNKILQRQLRKVKRVGFRLCNRVYITIYTENKGRRHQQK